VGLKGSSIRRLLRIPVVFILLFLTAAWGSVGHRIINGNVIVHLPSSVTPFIQHIQFLADHASDADGRKGGDNKKPYILREGPRHFIDIDDYPEFATKSVPQNLTTLIARSDSATVFGNGTNPWATIWTMDSLTAQMRRGDWSSVWQSAADLGHYVGDAHQPLHNTKDYDGRSSVPGSNGIHSRYESGMISAYQTAITITPDSVHYISNPIGFMFDIIYQSNSYVDSIYLADIYAHQASGWSGSGSVPQSYYAALWEKTGSFTKLEIQRATENYASLLYTAWVDAGSPVVTSVKDIAFSKIAPHSIVLHQNFPNPFNPSTEISFQLSRDAHVTLTVYSLHGQQIAVLMDRALLAGAYQSSFDATGLSLASGLYLYRLNVHERGNSYSLTNKMVFLK
jgi:hypothetical protein